VYLARSVPALIAYPFTQNYSNHKQLIYNSQCNPALQIR